MIKEVFVSLEVARLLKEKGFDEICSFEWGVPIIDGGFVLQKWSINNGQIKNSDLIDDAYAAPTHQMAMAWLREEYKLLISIGIEDDGYYNIIQNIENKIFYDSLDGYGFCSYDEAVEAALKYSLENLL